MAKIRWGKLTPGVNEVDFDPEELAVMPLVELDGPVNCAYDVCGREIKDDGSRAIRLEDGRYFCSDGCYKLSTAHLGADAPHTRFVRLKYRDSVQGD